jgi:hypothetical protein
VAAPIDGTGGRYWVTAAMAKERRGKKREASAEGFLFVRVERKKRKTKKTRMRLGGRKKTNVAELC